MDEDEQAKPQSKPDSLLASVDLENIKAMEQPLLSVRDVPGGTISFLFEKISTTSLDDSDDRVAQPA